MIRDILPFPNIRPRRAFPRLRWGLGLIAVWIALLVAAPAGAIESIAKQVILVDYHTGAVLFEKQADELMPPSSMSKMMTVYMAFDRLKDGGLKLDDELPVSEKAWRKAGSKMFVEVNKRVRVEDLLRGIIIQSGNDASIVIAEGLGGDEKSFAAEMTRKAREIGLQDSVFKNSSGWPEEGHVVTARDLAILAKRTIADFPDYYHYYAEKNFKYGKIRQGNRNPLLYRNMGADGLKTGHTKAGGYGLTASAVRENRRLILVLNGLESARQRSTESQRLIEWGFREFDNFSLFKAGETVLEADVWLGTEGMVPLVLGEDLVMTLPRLARRKAKVKAVYTGPVPAPITKGQQIAKLVITAPGIKTREIPLLAGADVGLLGFFGRIGTAISFLLWGGLR